MRSRGWELTVSTVSARCIFNYHLIHSRCMYYLEQVLVIVPCPSCTSVAFCSRTCMQAGLDLYHRRECGLMRLLAASALNNFALMAVRALARHTAEELVAMRFELEAEPNTCWGTTSEAAEVNFLCFVLFFNFFLGLQGRRLAHWTKPCSSL